MNKDIYIYKVHQSLLLPITYFKRFNLHDEKIRCTSKKVWVEKIKMLSITTIVGLDKHSNNCNGKFSFQKKKRK